MTCHLMNATEPCARPQCPDYVPPVEGDHLRRRSVGARVPPADAARLAELRAEDQRTPGEIAENAAAMAEIEAA